MAVVMDRAGKVRCNVFAFDSRFTSVLSFRLFSTSAT